VQSAASKRQVTTEGRDLTKTSIRKSARAILLTAENRILLLQFHLPAGFLGPTPRTFWGLPGGAIEHNEDALSALRRELAEETGLNPVEIGPELWFGTNEITLQGEQVRAHERFFLVRTPTATLDTGNRTETERRIIQQHRWWSADELSLTADEVFPPRLGYWLDRFLRHGTAGPQEIPL
jgi:8-oxo-dGTP pyrophosphatase MutT (NUDIX family)